MFDSIYNEITPDNNLLGFKEAIMTGKTHMAIGVVTTLSLSMNQSIENQILMVTAAAIGSLIPDLDHPKAKLNQKFLLFKNDFFRFLSYFSISLILFYMYFHFNSKFFGLFGIVVLLVGLSTHRSFTHSILGFLAMSYITKIITSTFNLDIIYSGFMIGYGLHLLADFFTVKGIQLFYPIKKNISSPIVVKNNTEFENFIFICLSIYAMKLVYDIIRYNL